MACLEEAVHIDLDSGVSEVDEFTFDIPLGQEDIGRINFTRVLTDIDKLGLLFVDVERRTFRGFKVPLQNALGL